MSTSTVPSLIDYMVATARASDTLGARPGDPVRVFDGPTVIDGPPPFGLWVGMSEEALLPGGTSFVLAVEATQNWVGPGNRRRDESVTVHCVADAWSGDGESGMKTARDAAYGIVSAVEDMTRLDANQGGNVLFTDPGMTNARLYQMQVDGGSRALVAFDFVCKSRIGS